MRRRSEPIDPNKKPSLKVFVSLWPYLMEFKWRVIFALALLFSAKIATVTTPWILKQIVDSLDAQQALVVAPIMLLVFYGGLRFFSSFLGELRDILFSRVSERSMRRVAKNTLQHLHTLDLDFHQHRKTGGLSRDIERGVSGMSFLLRITVFNIVPTLIELAMVLIILGGFFGWIYSAVVLLAILSYVGFSILVTEWRTKHVRQEHQLDSLSGSRAIDSLLNYETVKYFNNEQYELSRFDHALQQYETARLKSRLSLGFLNSGQALVIAVFMTVMLIMAALDVQAKAYTVGDFVMINAYMIQLFIPLNFLGFVYREIRRSMIEVERLFELQNIKPKVQESDTPVELDELGSKSVQVDFENVSFSYDNERPILKDVSFSLEPGKTLAIVGHSGAGKSTIGKLLFRFYDPTSGSIKINGEDIRNLKLDQLRQAIGVVPQDAVLFNDSLEFNIAYGKPDATREEVEKVCERASLMQFVNQLPERFDTVVGERGVKISGGEKQRVAIARVLIKDPPILLFDEATSSLDTKVEREISQNVYDVAGKHTTLIIAHRLSTISSADHILVLKDGEVVEFGQHQQLLQAGGHYQELWDAQIREQSGKETTEAVANVSQEAR